MATEQKHVICRACHAQCALIVDFEDGKPVATHGYKDNPAYGGYSCIKGRQLANYHSNPSRLLHSMKRQPDGSHAPISWRDAAKEVDNQVQEIIAAHGPDAISIYLGTHGFNNFAGQSFLLAYMDAIQSTSIFSSVTIDQPGKGIASTVHGDWLAGPYRHDEWDGLMLVGTNPVISMLGGVGMNPARNLHEAKKRGMKLIVIDPRVTDVAQKADLHLQCRPGEDAAILASMARQIIEEDLMDREFVLAETEGFEALKKAVSPFTPERVAKRAGLKPEEIVEAARLYGSFNKGEVSCGTGANMSGYGNIAEYMARVLITLMGHWRRAGDLKRNVGVLMKDSPAIAAGKGSKPAWDFGRKLRVRDLGEVTGGLPTAALSDEILLPGEGQIKALFVLGGNPMLAWPDQIKAYEAMQALDLLVCFDPHMSKTCDLAHYVIAPKIPFEVHGTTALAESLGSVGGGWGYEEPYAQVADPIMDPPEDSDVCEEHEFIYAMAANHGLDLKVESKAVSEPEDIVENTTVFDTSRPMPDPLVVWDAVLKGSPISHRELRDHPDALKGAILGRQAEVIQPRPADWEGRLSIGHVGMLEELDEVAERLDKPVDFSEFPYRVISRRLNDVLNSCWHEVSGLRRRLPYHPAYMHPDDMADLGVNEGDVIKIESARSSIQCGAVTAPDVRPGCLAVPHSWGTNPGENEDPLGEGGNTGRLSFNDRDFDKRSGLPLMSAIPVRVHRVS